MNLKKFKIRKIIKIISSEHNGVKSGICNSNRIGYLYLRTSPNVWKLNNTLLYNPWFQEEVTREIRKYF